MLFVANDTVMIKPSADINELYHNCTGTIMCWVHSTFYKIKVLGNELIIHEKIWN